MTSFVLWLQATAQLREELQSKEKEHQLAVHTLRDKVTNTHTTAHTQTLFSKVGMHSKGAELLPNYLLLSGLSVTEHR